MKKIPCFGAFLTSILMVLFAVSATWADPVSLTPYTNDDTGESFYYVNMPYTAATSCTQNYSNPVAATASLDIVETDFAVLTDANGRITFKLYDDGGMGGSVTQNAVGNYHNCVNSTLTVTVPENYRLSVQGRMNTEGVSDYMFIYDAPDNSGTPLGERQIYSSDYVNGEEKGPYFSTGNAFTFFFETDYSGNYAGLDFTVSVLPVNSVSVNSVSNGEMAGTTSAVEGETVTLTATPSEGYVFGGIKVLDENGNRVPVNMNGNTVTFTMPATPVTVTPHFGDPEILSFDDDGCLDNGTFFLVKCEDNACTIAQGTEGSQGDGFMSFACWSDMVQYIEEDEGRLSSTIVLGSPLNLGGYDEDAGNCRMAFVPFGSNHAGFDGNENTVDGFCGKDAGNGSWFVYANYVKNVSLTNAYVYGLSAYLISGNTISNVTVDRATIIGGTGAGVIGNAASIGNVTVKNSNIHVGEYIEGFTIETVYAGALMAQMRTVEWSGPVLLQGNTVSAKDGLMGAYLGGVVGEVEGYSTSVNLTGISVEEATVNGGANGYYVGGLVGANSRGVSVAISQSSFTGTVSGGVVGGIIGHADNYESQVIIKNTYSVSTISGTTAGYIVGELSGGANVDFEGVSLFNNYHFGSDEVELGVGSVNGSVYEVARWMAGSGNVFGNVRNATETMTATAMGNYRYDYECMEDEVYWDFFMFSYSTWQEELGEDEYEDHADFDAATRNAVASEADMKSDMFAALLNRNPADYDAEYVASEHNIWSRSSTQNDGLPVFASGSLQPNRIVVVAEKSSMGLTLEQESSLGFNEWSGSFCDTRGSVSKAMIGYTDASGHLSSDFQEKVGALLETIASNAGTDAAMLVDKQGNEVLLSAALSSNQEWRVVTPKTYDVVYQYCDYQNVCRLFENVTGTLLAFLTPRVDQYADAADAPLQLVPNVVSYYALGWTEDELKFTFELQDEEGYSVDDAALGAQTPEGTDIWSFEDIAQKIRAAGVEGVKTIVLKYAVPSTHYGEFPLITVQNPKMVDMDIDVYGYDQNSSMVQVAQSSASGENDGITEGRVDYGVAVGIGEIQEKTGYTFDNTYSVAYQYIATLDNCTAPEPKNYVVTDRSFGTFEDLSAEMTACGTVEWKIENLNVGDATDVAILNNVKMASFAAKKKYGNSVTEKLVIVPSYSLVHYNVSFDLNLPEGIEDNSFIFFGRSWNAVKDLTVEGPNFPNVYTNACPTMIAWSPVADASELPSWYFDASYYKNYVNRNFLPYVTLDADNGNATTAYVYWKEDDCLPPETIVLYYTPKLKGAGIETSPATIVLKQTLNETLNTTVDHPMQVGDDRWYLQLPDVDDTMTFVVDVDVEKGYTISEITYEGIPKDDHGVVATDEEFTLGFNDPETGDRTLSVNTAMITSGELTIDFDYANYEVNFVRPTNELAVSLADKEVYVADPYTNEGWFDARVYTMANVDDEYASAMPELYALNGCIAWSTTSSYDAMSPVFRKFNETAVQNFGNSTELYPVYFTAEDNANLCSDAPTETFTVTAHGANLQGLELRQIIGVTGDGDVADTIKHQFTQDQDDETLWTLSVPKVSASQAVAESYVPFTFEIRAIPAEGYATYSESYYRLMVQEGDGALKVPYEDGILTTNGSNVTFYVDVIGGGYTVALDTTDWSYIAESNGVLGYSNDKHELYVLDADRDLPDSYELGETAQKLPVLYAASYQGSSHTFVIAGWTYYPERANCVVTHAKNDEIYCMGGGINGSAEHNEIFTDFSGDLVAAALAAEAAGNLVIENKIITLRPVWTSATKANVGAQRVTIGCPKNETIDGCGTNDHPMTISLSQTFSMAGEQVTLTHTSDSAIALPWIDGHEEIAMDVAIQANPGYEVNSIKFEFIDEEVAEYNSAEGKMVFQTWNYGVNTHIVPDGLSYSDYTVTFDISSLKDSIVVLGKSWMEFDGTKSMNVGTKNEYPKIYVFTDYESKFNEVLWADAARKETDFDEPADWDAWYTTFMSNTAIPKFNSDLIKNVLGDETSTEMTLYPLPVLYLQGDLEARSYQEISAVVDVDHFPEEEDYHGHIVLTQTWNGMTFKQKSYLSNYSDYYELKLKCPWPLDDTLEFKVVTEPDPGYEMSLASENISDPDGEGWGYNAETGILKISGTHLGDLTVSYILQHYNVDFSISADAEVFVASKLVSEDQYEVDWFDSQTDVTVDNIKAPVIYDANGCLVYWKVVDSDAHDSDLVNMLAYMISTESSDSASNMLVPDMEYTKCDQNSRTYKQTLTVEGEGTIHLEQVLGDAVVKHSFVEDGETGVLTLNVPAAYNEVEPDFQIQQTGVRFRVVAEPAEGYSLDEITYETYNDGNHQTNILRTDSSFVNVMRALPWTVKFKRLAPIYVTYDLSLSSAEDSANTYLPADAKTAETLEIASAADSVPFWKPFRTDVCFKGWSTTSLANFVEGDDSLFTAFNVDNFSEFSTIGDNATKLYAIWGECSESPAKTLAVENGEEHAKLVLYQLFGNDTLFHEITNDGLTLAGDAFDFYLDQTRTAPEFGYNFADEAEFALSYTYLLPTEEISEPVSVEKDGTDGAWRLTTDGFDSEPTYTFAIAMDDAVYHLALDANAEDVFYGPGFSWNWSSEDASYEDMLPSNVYRAGYVLAGWTFDGDEQLLRYDDDFIAAFRNYRKSHENVAPDTLHAVWTRSGQIGTYILQLSPETQERAAGTLTFSQTIGDSMVVSTIEGGTLLVPAIEGLQLNANFTLDSDHSFDGSAPISVMDYLGNPIGSYADGDAITLDESFGAAGTTIYIDVATAYVDYSFAFDVNAAAGDTLFYGTNWQSEKSYSMESEDRAFPLSVYQRGKCLIGFAFSETATASYTGITPEFVAAYNELDTKPTTLYGVWAPKGDDCNPATVTLTTENTSAEGAYMLTNADNDYVGPSKDVPVVIPVADDLVFTVSFIPEDIYYADETISLSGSDDFSYDLANGSEFMFKQDIVLKAETYLSSIEVVLDMNAGSSNVFYGEDFNSFWWRASSYGDTIPKDAYRTDAKLVGWSFYRNATPDQVFQVYDESFYSRYEDYLESVVKNITPIAEGDSDLPDYGVDFPTSQYPVLHAVWKKDSVETRMVTSESADQGVLMLSQNVGDSVFSYIVTEQGLQVPAVDNGIKFMVSFYPNDAWQLDGERSIVLAEKDKTVGYVENNAEWNMTQSTAISIQANFNGFRFVFDVDSSETVFYGDDWVAQGNYGISANKPADLPKMVYSSARCLAGWSVKSDSKHFYTALNESLVEEINEAYPKLPRDGSVAVTLYAHWATNVEDCAGKFNLVSIEQENGKIALVEAERRSMIDGKVEEENEKVHVFTDKGSMFLPADIPGNWYGVRSVPDSSFILDSLAVILDSHIVAVLHEGELLPEEIHGASFKAYFGKSNKTSIEIVEKEFLQSDNAIKLSFKASDFEVTRGVLARVQIIDVQSDTVVRDTLIGDSIAMAYEDSLVLLMNKPGTYKMVLTLEDSAELAEYSEEFVVKAAIEAFEADGWQMVSLAAVDTSAIDWTTGDQVFYWWDESGTGEYWNYKAFGRGDSIVNTRGAWYSSLKGNSLALLKDIEDDGKDAVWELDSVTSGWNLVANTHGWSVNLFANHPEAQKDVDEESEISFWSYNAEKADYEEVSVLKPYEAVWVKVSKKTEWTVSGAPVFTSKNDKETTEPETEGDSLEGRVLPRRVLAKSSTKDRWTLQAMLSDKNGKQDVWNILGAGNNPFVAEEPPSSMGDHVSLSILEGKRALAKSIKTSSDEMEWTVALSAASDRVGYLSLVGIDGVNAYGYHVYVTVDGNTTEMKDGVPLKVYLKSSAKTATVRVATAAKAVVQNTLRGLRSARLGNKLQVSFDASEGLAGTNARVDLMDMKGHVMSTVSAKTVAGSNALVLDAPKSGLYMLRVRAGSAQQAGKVLVK